MSLAKIQDLRPVKIIHDVSSILARELGCGVLAVYMTGAPTYYFGG